MSSALFCSFVVSMGTDSPCTLYELIHCSNFKLWVYMNCERHLTFPFSIAQSVCWDKDWCLCNPHVTVLAYHLSGTLNNGSTELNLWHVTEAWNFYEKTKNMHILYTSKKQQNCDHVTFLCGHANLPINHSWSPIHLLLTQVPSVFKALMHWMMCSVYQCCSVNGVNV